MNGLIDPTGPDRPRQIGPAVPFLKPELLDYWIRQNRDATSASDRDKRYL